MKKLLSTAIVVLGSIAALQAQNIEGSWHGALDLGIQKLEMAFHFVKDAEGKDVAHMDVPVQGIFGYPMTINCLTADSVCVEAPSLQLTYAGKLNMEVIEGTFSQMGMSFPMSLEKGNLAGPARPQEPQPPYGYQTKEVSFHNTGADVVLSGTLTYPTGYSKDRKVPVVLMVSGSGAQDRNEEIYSHKPFLVIADYLARHGIASLRYDDRGVGKSSGDPNLCTSEDFAEDAASGLEMLRESGEFSKVGILGHSEGGMIAFMLAAEGKADFIVSMAGPGIKGDTLLAEQQKAILASKGIVTDVTVKTVREQVGATIGHDVWMDFFLDYDPQPDIERVTVPVMAINGSNDLQVIPESNLKAISALLSGKNGKNLIKEYPDLNHLFQHCTPQTAMDYYNIEETCSPEVLQDIADWINGL